MPDPRLDAAYRASDYWVDGPGGRFAIRVGEICPQIEAGCWAYITACNPRSMRLTSPENDVRMRRLEADVVDAGFAYLHGAGIGRNGTWPPEPSLLILEIDEASACSLARRHGQAAIVVGRRGEVAQLVWIDD